MSALISLVRRTLPCYFERDELHDIRWHPLVDEFFCNTLFGSLYMSPTHLSSHKLDPEQASFSIRPSGLERHIIDTTLPLLDVHILLSVARRPEDQTRGIFSRRSGQRPHSLVVWTDFWREPNHRCQFSFKPVQVLRGNQNREVCYPSYTVRMV